MDDILLAVIRSRKKPTSEKDLAYIMMRNLKETQLALQRLESQQLAKKKAAEGKVMWEQVLPPLQVRSKRRLARILRKVLAKLKAAGLRIGRKFKSAGLSIGKNLLSLEKAFLKLEAIPLWFWHKMGKGKKAEKKPEEEVQKAFEDAPEGEAAPGEEAEAGTGEGGSEVSGSGEADPDGGAEGSEEGDDGEETEAEEGEGVGSGESPENGEESPDKEDPDTTRKEEFAYEEPGEEFAEEPVEDGEDTDELEDGEQDESPEGLEEDGKPSKVKKAGFWRRLRLK